MPRSLPAWRGKTPDARVPPRVRLRCFERYGGVCQCGCGMAIAEGRKWELDHITALINGGEHCELNLRPLLKEHHKKKSRDDVALKTYNYRRRLARAGIKKRSRPILGSRASGWKITFSRGIVRR